MHCCAKILGVACFFTVYSFYHYDFTTTVKKAKPTNGMPFPKSSTLWNQFLLLLAHKNISHESNLIMEWSINIYETVYNLIIQTSRLKSHRSFFLDDWNFNKILKLKYIWLRFFVIYKIVVIVAPFVLLIVTIDVE